MIYNHFNRLHRQLLATDIRCLLMDMNFSRVSRPKDAAILCRPIGEQYGVFVYTRISPHGYMRPSSSGIEVLGMSVDIFDHLGTPHWTDNRISCRNEVPLVYKSALSFGGILQDLGTIIRDIYAEMAQKVPEPV